jgi:hypothetical protein
MAGADPGFQVRGGTLKKIAPSRGRREIILSKKIIFFPIAKIFGVFRVKNHDFTPNKSYFSLF